MSPPVAARNSAPSVTPKPGMLRMISAWRWRRNRSSIIVSVAAISVSRVITSLASRATRAAASCCPGTTVRCASAAVDGTRGDGISVTGLAFTQPRFHARSTGAAKSIRGLVTGQQHQRGLAVAVVERPLQRREVLEQLGAQPVDRPGPISDQVATASGEEAQVHRDVVTRSQGLQVASHPGLIGDHCSILGVGLPVAAVPAGGVVDGAARDVEQSLLGGDEQRDQQCGTTVVEIDRPGDFTALGERCHRR